MKALVVEDFKRSPRWTDFADPVADKDEVVVQVTAAALSNLTRAQANGTHYSSIAAFPFVPGTDGVGKLADGSRVFFYSPKKPFGSMAERTLVRKDFCIPLPADLQDVVAASIANPVMSSWAALTRRAKFVKGENVFINGATGSSGRLAVKIARHLGAQMIVATGRDPEALQLLRRFGADEVISLKQPPDDLVQKFRQSLADFNVSVVLDYLWGNSAEALLTAIGGPGAKHSDRPLRYVQIGSISGNSIPFPASVLRSTALQLMGSGLGSVSDLELVATIREAFQVAVPLGLDVDRSLVSMPEAEGVWNQDAGRERLVFTLA